MPVLSGEESVTQQGWLSEDAMLAWTHVPSSLVLSSKHLNNCFFCSVLMVNCVQSVRTGSLVLLQSLEPDNHQYSGWHELALTQALTSHCTGIGQ